MNYIILIIPRSSKVHIQAKWKRTEAKIITVYYKKINIGELHGNLDWEYTIWSPKLTNFIIDGFYHKTPTAWCISIKFPFSPRLLHNSICGWKKLGTSKLGNCQNVSQLNRCLHTRVHIPYESNGRISAFTSIRSQNSCLCFNDTSYFWIICSGKEMRIV